MSHDHNHLNHVSVHAEWPQQGTTGQNRRHLDIEFQEARRRKAGTDPVHQEMADKQLDQMQLRLASS
jgi:hypothetical protein